MYVLFVLWFLLSFVNGSFGNVHPVRAPDAGPPYITPSLSKFIQGLLAYYNIPGLSLAVARQEGKYEAGGWGKRNEDFDFVTPETLFATGSCSKAFLSTAFGILIDDFAHGRNKTPLPSGVRELSWDTKVQHLLPGEWKLLDDWASAKAGVRDLLTHSSGLSSHDFSYAPTDSLMDLIHRLRHLKPEAELRQKWVFTDQMYYVVAYIISKYTQGSYSAFVQERIFKPLNMTSSTFSIDQAIKSGKLSQSWIDPGYVVPSLLTAQSEELVAGGLGVISNAVDMSKWATAVMNSGIDPETKKIIIPGEIFNETKTAQVITLPSASGSIIGYGLGWFRNTLGDIDVIQHAASLPGTASLITLVPSRGVAIVVLANVDRYQALVELTFRVLFDSVIERPGTSSPTQPMVTPPKDGLDAVQSVPLESYAGTYFNAGYGNVTLCAPTSATASCKETIADFSALKGGALAPGLYASWPRFFSSHLRLTAISEMKFRAEPTRLFVHGYGKKTSPFELVVTQATVEFGVAGGKVAGIALFDVIEKTPETIRAEAGLSLDQRADVWFVKVV